MATKKSPRTSKPKNDPALHAMTLVDTAIRNRDKKTLSRLLAHTSGDLYKRTLAAYTAIRNEETQAALADIAAQMTKA